MQRLEEGRLAGEEDDKPLLKTAIPPIEPKMDPKPKPVMLSSLEATEEEDFEIVSLDEAPVGVVAQAATDNEAGQQDATKTADGGGNTDVDTPA